MVEVVEAKSARNVITYLLHVEFVSALRPVIFPPTEKGAGIKIYTMKIKELLLKSYVFKKQPHLRHLLCNVGQP